MGIFSFITDLFSTGGKKPGRKTASSPKNPGHAVAARHKTGKKSAARPADGLSLSLSHENAKKRKKSRQISADPIDKDALGFGLSLKDEDAHATHRDALRVKVDGLSVLVRRLGKRFPVTDISATGLRFAFEKPHFKGGVQLEMDFILNGRTKVSGVMTKVMRHEQGTVGCVFQDLDRAQDDAVHAIVLLGQKQQANRRHAQRDKEFRSSK